MKTQINPSQICLAKSFPKQRNHRYEYMEERPIFFGLFGKRKAGFYFSLFIGEPSFSTKEQIERDGELYCEYNQVFFKPHIQLFMSNQSCVTKYFDDVKSMEEFMNSDEMKSINWVTI